MLFKKLLRTFGKYKAQFISMIVMIFLGVAIFAAFNGEWYSIEKDTHAFFEETNLADYQVYNTKGTFTETDLNKILAIDGVDAATRFTEIDTTESKEKDTLKLTVSENYTVSTFTLLEGKEYDASLKDAVWVSHNYMERNDYEIGDAITLTYGSVTKTLTIQGIMMSGEYLINIADGSAVMPDYNTCGYAYTTPAVYEEICKEFLPTAVYAQINVKSSLDSDAFSEKVDDALGFTVQVVPKEDAYSYSEAMGEADEGKTMALLLPVIFLLIAVLTMVTTMNRITSNEKVQIGILKALGYKNRRIVWHYTSYALAIGLVGTLLGFALGYPVCWVIYSEKGSMGTYFEMPDWSIHMPWFVYAGCVGIVLFLTLIGFLSVKKQLKGSAAEALRPYEPKKMKNMLLEKTKLFHKLNFATRWNLRDTSRHMARTAVSVFGVFGCTLLLFASFGMVSTMKDYVSVNYNVQMNYATAVSLADTVTNVRAKEIAKTLDGDYSGSVAVKADGNTYTMTVFNYSNDKVRLICKNRKIDNVSSEGVYVCQRMKETLKCRTGDTFTFSIYGESEKYTAEIVGFCDSNTEGFSLSETYAEKLGVSYKIDTVYTDTVKENITTDKEIVSLMSKEGIIASFDTFMEIMNMMIYVLVAFSAVLAFVVLYNLGTMSFVERYRELATLKVLGFRDRKIRNILISQNVWTTIAGIIIGVPVGYYTLVILYKALASEYELTVTAGWYVYVISIALTFVVSLVVSWLASRKVKKINMVEALKAE